MSGGLGLSEQIPKASRHRSLKAPLGRALLEENARPAAVPVVCVREETQEFDVRLRVEVKIGGAWESLRGEAVDTPSLFVVGGVAAYLGVVPIENIDRSIRPDFGTETHPSIVVCEQSLVSMMSHKP